MNEDETFRLLKRVSFQDAIIVMYEAWHGCFYDQCKSWEIFEDHRRDICAEALKEIGWTLNEYWDELDRRSEIRRG